ncbi:hypothetical protein COCOBI_07-4950 [Coccomyxa sp. Obi]|nr:hypothetical protein COCOBI_07-4950 [Coccomyxa sp. Obi]
MLAIDRCHRGQADRHTICPVSTFAQKQSASPITPPVTRPPSRSRIAPSNFSTADANLASSRGITNVGTILAGALLPFLQQRWAQADTIEGEPTDVLITGIFVVVIVALAIVTLGVAYLSISSFLDKRAEEEDKKKFEAAQRNRDLQALGINRPKRKRSSDEMTRGGGKGFGS